LASSGSIAEIIADVNVQLTHDVHSSSRFVTLFYLVIETQQGKLRWGRAGHEPAIFYDGKTKEFEELKGSGMALGINPAARYEENQRSPLAKGSIIVLYTDGIWEARNDQNDMFGKARIYDIIRRQASAPAETIMNAILEAIQVFQGSAAFEDDATLVVAKILEDLG
jgi:sigma-B regulation protein RsbU (phosphoserine phosphatase)